MNKAILIGRLTRDPELRYTSSNRAVCQFTVAIDRPFTNQASGQREADFINVVAWDKTGENVGKYMTKGRLIFIYRFIYRCLYSQFFKNMLIYILSYLKNIHVNIKI